MNAPRAFARLSALLLFFCACSRREQINYRHCLNLRIGMTREQLLGQMGPPASIFPYIPGKSLPYLAGRTAYEWPNPSSMPSPDHVSVDDKTGRVESIRCAGIVIEAGALSEPNISTAAVAAAEARFAASRARAARRGSSAPRENPGWAPGQPLNPSGN